MKLSVLINEEVNNYWFEKMIKMENRMFPPEGNDYLEPDYVRGLYKDHKEGLFFCIDEDTNELAGYFTVIFISDQQKDQYLKGMHFSQLQNIGIKEGKNIVYLYTIAVDDEYRGKACMKLMGKAFAQWMNEKIEEGCEASEIYAEAVSVEGAKSLTKGFELVPMEDVNEKGIGHYKSLDHLKSYIIKMLKA